MKKLIMLVLSLVWLATGVAQTPEQNMMKYWKHRSQLDRFILKGPGIDPATVHGSYLLAEHRRPVDKTGIGNLGGSPTLHWTTHWPDLVDGPGQPRCGGLNFGPDATMNTGFYIGMLATEYRLLVNNGRDGTETLTELWNVLEAIERLDRMAESLLPGHGPAFNGYFLRDDVLFDLATRDDNFDGVQNFPEINCAIGKFEFRIKDGEAQFNDFSSDPFDVTILDQQEYDNSPSGDQTIGLLMGLALVTKMVDSGAMVNGESVLRKAQFQAHLIGDYARHRNYRMTNANHQGQLETIGLALLSYPIAETINWITENNDQSLDLNGDDIPGDALENYHTDVVPNFLMPGFAPDSDGLWRTVWTEMLNIWSSYMNGLPTPNIPSDGSLCAWDAMAVLTGFPGASQLLPIEEMDALNHACWSMENPSHLFQIFTAAAISNKWVNDNLMRDAATMDGLELYPLLSDVLFNEDVMSQDNKAACKLMIESAPCDKFCSCTAEGECDRSNTACNVSMSCTPVSGWHSTNRYAHNNWTESGDLGAEHSGIDFLLLYNLYHLKYPDELPSVYDNNYLGSIHDSQVHPEPEFETLGINVNCNNCIGDEGLLISENEITSSAQLEIMPGVSSPDLVQQDFPADVTYRAGKKVVLYPGFSAAQGTRFRAYIDPFECETSTLARVASTEPSSQEIPSDSIYHEEESGLSIFPNPTSGNIQVTSAKPISQLRIIDMTGSEVLVVDGVGRKGLNVASIPKGLQVVHVLYEDSTFEFKKLIVN